MTGLQSKWVLELGGPKSIKFWSRRSLPSQVVGTQLLEWAVLLWEVSLALDFAQTVLSVDWLMLP